MDAGTEDWFDRELAGSSFADERLGKRLRKLVELMGNAIGSTVPLACQDWANTLHVDDTPVPVLAPGLGRTKTGRLWTYGRLTNGHLKLHLDLHHLDGRDLRSILRAS